MTDHDASRDEQFMTRVAIAMHQGPREPSFILK